MAARETIIHVWRMTLTFSVYLQVRVNLDSNRVTGGDEVDMRDHLGQQQQKMMIPGLSYKTSASVRSTFERVTVDSFMVGEFVENRC